MPERSVFEQSIPGESDSIRFICNFNRTNTYSIASTAIDQPIYNRFTFLQIQQLLIPLFLAITTLIKKTSNLSSKYSSHV
ncbi:MAG: hypothetical protein IPN93_09790 [Bacteroidetes bacterium]|nr:hypothetical protein [Bacteroidota bacterium]